MGDLVFLCFVPCWRWVNVLRLSLLAASGCKTRLVWLHADFQIKLNICDWSCVCIIMYIISSFFLPLLAFEVLVCGLKSFKIQTKQQALFRILFLFFAAIFLILDAFSSPSPSFSYLAQHPVSIRTVASTPLASVSSYQDLSRFYSHHETWPNCQTSVAGDADYLWATIHRRSCATSELFLWCSVMPFQDTASELLLWCFMMPFRDTTAELLLWCSVMPFQDIT